jgi:recombination protein RecA
MGSNKTYRVKKVIESVTGLFTNPFNQHQRTTVRTYKTDPNIATLSSGFRPLDKALGIGGLPYNKITELIGPGATSLSGTTSIAARMASKVQRKQQVVTIIDMSHSFDTWYAEQAGLIAPQLLLTQPDTVFDTVTTLERSTQNEGMVIVVMGIVAELLNHAEPDLLKTLLGRLRSIVRQSNNIFLFVTSPQKKDPFSPANYPAGFPLADLADVRLWVQDESWTYKEGLASAYKASLAVIKNRLAIAGKGADIRIKFSPPRF